MPRGFSYVSTGHSRQGPLLPYFRRENTSRINGVVSVQDNKASEYGYGRGSELSNLSGASNSGRWLMGLSRSSMNDCSIYCRRPCSGKAVYLWPGVLDGHAGCAPTASRRQLSVEHKWCVDAETVWLRCAPMDLTISGYGVEVGWLFSGECVVAGVQIASPKARTCSHTNT
jgi:hypothetical protein